MLRRVSLSELEPGHVIAATYEVVQRLDRGDESPVYAVKHLPSGTARALKLLPSELLEGGIERLRREASIGGSIQSRRIVAVEDTGVEGDAPWITMELLVGHDLGALLAQRSSGLPEARTILIGLGEALRDAHRAGVCHGDLRPELVFLETHGQRAVKVLGFGVSRRLAEAVVRSPGLASSPTPRWLWGAPERAATGAALDPRADVWTYGLIAYRVVTGALYWRGEGAAAVLRELLEGRLPRASERAAESGASSLLPSRFEAWFARCVARDPEARFADGGEALEALVTAFGPVPSINIPPIRGNPKGSLYDAGLRDFGTPDHEATDADGQAGYRGAGRQGRGSAEGSSHDRLSSSWWKGRRLIGGAILVVVALVALALLVSRR